MVFLAAIFFMIVLIPFWFYLSILWGIFNGFISLIKNFFSVFSDDLNLIEAVIFVFLRVISDGLSAFIELPAWLWNFARYGSPVIAFIIAIIVVVLYSIPRNVAENEQ